MKLCKLLIIGFLLWTIQVKAENTFKLDAILTDNITANGKIGKANDVFYPDTIHIYVVWTASHLKSGQHIRAVWIAEDTNDAVHPNYKLEEMTLPLTQHLKLPSGSWQGKFMMNKPGNGWAVGRYRIDIFVDDDLAKSIFFHVDSPKVTVTTNVSKWGAIAVDRYARELHPFYGVGNGDTTIQANRNAEKFCQDAGGKRCQLVLTYQQCGAYAVSRTTQAKGEGESKKIAEQNALSACKNSLCQVLISDCN